MGKMEKGFVTAVMLRNVINPFIIDHSIVIYAVFISILVSALLLKLFHFVIHEIVQHLNVCSLHT